MVYSIALANLKPGVGKSTSAVFLAQALQEADLPPLLVDADKGRTAQRWHEMAGGFRWPVVSMSVTDLHRKLPELETGRESMVIDVPQVEDHARIARGALRYADTWVLPVAPSIVEVDRMFAAESDSDDSCQLLNFLNDVQDQRETPADIVVLFTRTNTSRPTRTGPDAEAREVIEGFGLTVLDTQIRHHDEQYRQSGGTTIRAIGTPYERLLRELLARRKDA
jgi:chromosome partitioning protein